MEWSNETAVARARSGDADAFRVLVERHSRALFGLAFRMTGNEQDAEDVVQESLLRAYKQLGKFDERSSFGTWLYRITVNCSLDVVRARKSRPEQCPPADPELADPAEAPAATGPAPRPTAMIRERRRRT